MTEKEANEIMAIIDSIKPFKNFTQDMLDGFAMATLSIGIEIGKYLRKNTELKRSTT